MVTLKTTPEFNIGDTPSAFMMSSTKDLENWIKMQLEPSDKTRSIVEQSHQAISKSEGIADANGYGQDGLLIRMTILFITQAL